MIDITLLIGLVVKMPKGGGRFHTNVQRVTHLRESFHCKLQTYQYHLRQKLHAFDESNAVCNSDLFVPYVWLINFSNVVFFLYTTGVRQSLLPVTIWLLFVAPYRGHVTNTKPRSLLLGGSLISVLTLLHFIFQFASQIVQTMIRKIMIFCNNELPFYFLKCLLE